MLLALVHIFSGDSPCFPGDVGSDIGSNRGRFSTEGLTKFRRKGCLYVTKTLCLFFIKDAKIKGVKTLAAIN